MMGKKNQQTCLLVISLSLIISFLNSCAQKKESAVLPSTEDYPITISVFTFQNQQTPPEDNKIYKWIKEKFNVTFQWDIAVGQKDQKIGTMIAAQDYPDLLLVDSTKFIEAGALIPLEDLIEKYGPNLKKHYASVWEKIKEDDGHIYCLPNWGVIDGQYKSTYYGDSALWIQKDVLKEFGYPKIKTLDEYFDIIAKYKEKHPTINGLPAIGFSILTYDWRAFCLINPPNFLAGNPNDGNVVVDKKTFDARVFLGLDISKKWFKKLNEMNAKGLIDRSSFVDNYDQYMAKLSSGRVLGIHDQYWQFQDATTALLNQNMYIHSMAPLPIVFDESIKPWYRNRPLPNLRRGYGISIKAKDPVRIIRFLDAQLSEEAQKVFQWGFLNEDYQLDEKGVPFRTEEQRNQQNDPVWKLRNKAELWFGDAPKMEGTFSDGNPTSIGEIPAEALAAQRPEDAELLQAYGVSSFAELMDPNPPENPVYFPAWQLVPPDGSAAQIAWKKAEDLYRKYLPRIILSRPNQFDKLWDEYVSELNKIGLEEYEKFMNQEIKKRVDRWSPKK
ncbi:MAG: extracellular solute-binding protein [Spirochaetota bacterium]